MPNKHIKIINGRRYYYESIRRGKKVTSRYIGPVERLRKMKKTFLPQELALGAQTVQQEPQEEGGQEDADNDYIG